MPICWFYSPEEVSMDARRVFSVIFIVYCLVISTVNLLLIFSMFATKQSMTNTSNFLIVSLSISDSFIGAVVMPIRAIESFWLDSKGFCFFMNISRALQSFLSSNSLLMTMFLAVERYLHMNPDFHPSTSCLAKLFKGPKICALTVSLSLLSTAITLVLHFKMDFNLKLASSFNIFYGLFYLIISILFVALYTRGYLRIRRFVAENPIYANRGEVTSNESPEYLNELFKTVLLLLIAMTVSWLPLIIFNLTVGYWSFADNGHIDSDSYYVFSNTAKVLFYSNNAVNALIIFYRNKKSREWLVKLFRFRTKRMTEEEVQNESVVISNTHTVVH